MKKTVCVVLCAILMLSTAFADSEITFLNVPWHSNETEALETMIGNGFIREKTAIPDYLQSPGYYITTDEDVGFCPVKSEAFKEVSYSISLAGKTSRRIAGCLVKDIVLTFANNRTESLLISAKIELYGAGFEEMKNVLSQVYGKYEEFKAGDDFETVIWRGENNTAIVLFTENEGFTYQFVYGRLDAEETFRSCLSTINEKPETLETSGL